MSKNCIFTDPLLITSYVSALLILFFHNKLLFYNDNEQIKPLSVFVCRLQAMLFRLPNRSGRTMLLKTDEAYEAHNITGNKTDFITYIFFLNYCLDLGLLHCLPENFFLNIHKRKFSKDSERLVPQRCAFG